jgi:CysZ protein
MPRAEHEVCGSTETWYMFEAAFRALGQMFSPPFRTVLLKSAGLAILVLALLTIGLFKLSGWLAETGGAWAEGTIGSLAHTPLVFAGWILAFAVGFGLFAGAIFLMPAVTALTASFFVDEIADHVEAEHYAGDAPGKALPLARATYEGVKTALLAVAIYFAAMPFLLFAGLGAVIFFFATAWLLGREYFELVAMRYRPVPQAKALRRFHATSVFTGGLFIAAFVSIPILNLATPLFGTAFMVHLYKRLAGENIR